VSFRLKSDVTGTRQYGLIAEEVAKVYPELVIRDDSGRIDGVRYDELAPMLLNEVQQQQRKVAAQAEVNAAQDRQNAVQAAEIRDLKQQQLRTQQQLEELTALNNATQAALQKFQANDQIVVKR
jgi:hypothetical protein